MPDDTRKSKVILEAETKGTDDVARDLEAIGKSIRGLNKEFERTAHDGVETLTDAIRRDLNSALDETAQKAGNIKLDSGGSGGNAPAAAKFRGAAGLVGGEAASNVVGIIDDVQDAFEGLSAAAKSAPGALASAASALGPVGLGLAAVAAVAAAAFIHAAQSIQAEAQKIDAQSKSRLSLSQRLPDLTQSGAQAELEHNAEVRKNLMRDLELAQKDYNDFLETQKDAFGNAGQNKQLLKIFDAREDSYARAIEDAQALITSLDADSELLQGAMKEGRVKADEVTAAEQKLADTRSTDTKKGIDQAAKAEQQRAREAEKSAAEQERNAEQSRAAQQKYSESIKNVGRQFKEASTDIGAKLKQGLADNLTGLFRDVEDIATTFRRDTFEQDIKQQRDERDALTDHYRDLVDLRDEAKQSEAEAIRNGDFKELFLARQKAAQDVQLSEKTAFRERQDRQRGATDERSDLLRSAGQERSDRQLAYARQNTDSRLAADRELSMAKQAKSRSLTMAREAYNAELKLLRQYLNDRQKMMSGGTGRGGIYGTDDIPHVGVLTNVMRK